jgi:hypothetical protein
MQGVWVLLAAITAQSSIMTAFADLNIYIISGWLAKLAYIYLIGIIIFVVKMF